MEEEIEDDYSEMEPDEMNHSKKSAKTTDILAVKVQSSAAAIEDSMNDRDLESSITNHMLTAPPLP